MRGSVASRVVQIIAKVLGKKVRDIKPNDDLVDDLGADSLAVTEIMMMVEDEFDIRTRSDKWPPTTWGEYFPSPPEPPNAKERRRVGNLVAYVEHRVAA
jgi:acyl carrier protein